MSSLKEIFSDKSKLLRLIESPATANFPSLKKAFLQSIEESTKDVEKAAVLFSGGVDSSLVAKAVSEKVHNTVLFSVGLKGSTALKFSAGAAESLGLSLERILVKEDELPILLDKTSKAINSRDFLQLQIAVPEFIALRAVKEHSFKHVFFGQGVDELFFGYDEFRRALEKGASFEKLEQLRKEKLLRLWDDNISRDFALAKHFNLELRAPFLIVSFVKQALAFSAQENISSPKDFLRKRVLRKLAAQLSIPKEIVWKRKKAIQYDSGLSKELKKLLRT